MLTICAPLPPCAVVRLKRVADTRGRQRRRTRRSHFPQSNDRPFIIVGDMPTFPLPATKISVTTRHNQSKQVTAFQACSYGAVTLKGKQREEPVDLSSATELNFCFETFFSYKRHLCQHLTPNNCCIHCTGRLGSDLQVTMGGTYVVHII
jgi:hypothetical protein